MSYQLKQGVKTWGARRLRGARRRGLVLPEVGGTRGRGTTGRPRAKEVET